MSIWCGDYSVEIPTRDQYGGDDGETEGGDIGVSTSGLSPLIRFDAPSRVYMSTDEARQLGQALIDAADLIDSNPGTELDHIQSKRGTL